MLMYFLIFLCSIIFLNIFGRILFELFLFHFGTKVIADVNKCEIYNRDMGSHKVEDLWYVLRINYSYEYRGKEYQSSAINSFGSLFTKNKKKLNTLLENHISNNKITVYVLSCKPSFSYCLPLKWNNFFIFWMIFMSLGIVLLTILIDEIIFT